MLILFVLSANLSLVCLYTGPWQKMSLAEEGDHALPKEEGHQMTSLVN